MGKLWIYFAPFEHCYRKWKTGGRDLVVDTYQIESNLVDFWRK